MAQQRRMKNKQRDLTKVMEERTLLVESALDVELTSKEDICKATGLTRIQLNTLFQENKPLYARYCVIRKLLVEQASDNISSIIYDKDHPKNYDASKWVVTNYKSDLDSTLESKKENEIEVELGGDGTQGARPTIIRFGTKKKEEDSD